MKKLLSILILIPLLSFSQYPSWFPNEFKNKILCGSKYNYDTRGNDSYKLYVSEDGFQLTINGKKSIKINYKTIKISENDLWKNFEFDLRSSNETKDSPYDPKIKLKKISIEVPTDFYYSLKKRKNNLTRDEHRQYYKTIEWAEKRGSLESHYFFNADIIGKYFTTNIYEAVYKRDICGNLKTKAEILKEEKVKRKEELEKEERIKKEITTLNKNIVDYLENDNLSEAFYIYNQNKTYCGASLELLKSKLSDKLDELLLSDKIEYAIELHNKHTNFCKEKFSKLESKAAEKSVARNIQHNELISLIKENKSKIAIQEGDYYITSSISDGIVISSKSSGEDIIINSDCFRKEIDGFTRPCSFNEIFSVSKDISFHGLTLPSSYDSNIDHPSYGKLCFFYAKNKKGEDVILNGYASSGSPSNNKYSNVKKISNIGFNNELNSKNVKIIFEETFKIKSNEIDKKIYKSEKPLKIKFFI